MTELGELFQSIFDKAETVDQLSVKGLGQESADEFKHRVRESAATFIASLWCVE